MLALEKFVEILECHAPTWAASVSRAQARRLLSSTGWYIPERSNRGAVL